MHPIYVIVLGPPGALMFMINLSSFFSSGNFFLKIFKNLSKIGLCFILILDFRNN